MSRLIYSAVAILLAAGVSPAVTTARANDATISLSWRLIGNRPVGGYRAQLTLRNEGPEALAGDWALYFNSASRLLADSAPPEFSLTHINGDFYVLRPKTSATQIDRGDSRSIAWDGAPWAISISDAPAGFYLIREGPTACPSVPIAVPLRIEPFPAPEKLRRGAADIVPVVTAEARYAENESLTRLPLEQLVKVVPTPAEIKPLPGQLTLRRSIKILHEPTLADEARFLASSLQEVLDAEIAVASRGPTAATPRDAIRLRVGQIEVDGTIKRHGDESYLLTVSPENGVEIVGSDPAGVFYGVQTLRALLPINAYRKPAAEITIDAVRIADAPRFQYRGLHLDVARNFQTEETVKKLLDLMAFYKLNRFHWHLTDDEGWRIEIKKLPELTEVGGRRGHTLDETEHLVPSYGSGPVPEAGSSSGSGFYTQDDFIEILRFAKERHISVIPELDFPGHARAAVKAMEARHQRLSPRDEQSADEFLLRESGDSSPYESVQMWRDNVVDVGREATYRFLTVVVGELADMYDRAGVPLISIHLGGDEVPKGVWERSAACERILTDEASKIPRRGQLELYFLNRASELVRRHSVQPACWEDCLLLEVEQDSAAGETRRAAGKPVPTAYVWNNVWGWGREDAAYRLANAGFDVVLCNATHLYLDLACEKDPLEPGYYWAGFVEMRAPFELVPLDVFKNAARNAMGQPVTQESLAGRARLTRKGAQHIRGIQGQLWGENLRSPQNREYMAFRRAIAVAERAWAKSSAWADIEDPQEYQRKLARDWNQFANRLGQRELPRLDYLRGGVNYRLPPPGAKLRGDRVWANVAIPGLQIRYTTDGTEPTADDEIYQTAIPAADVVRLRSFDTRGRGGRTVTALAPKRDAR
ncbi:MAG: family 20 glycosylhydrolase [Pirellulales bacterium]